MVYYELKLVAEHLEIAPYFPVHDESSWEVIARSMVVDMKTWDHGEYWKRIQTEGSGNW